MFIDNQGEMDPTTEGPGRGGENSAETEDLDADMPIDSTADNGKANTAMFADAEPGEGELEAPTNVQDVDEEDSDEDATDDEENETDADASITTEKKNVDTRG
ncbi:hypothetical protein L208DRAFT_1379712 [Tricholoma matsutake]|nr:hypothetical protein L208DRAFT_1379712 [Tricholoma matsutake 945]